MDVAKLEKEWGQEFKDVKSAAPVDKDLLGEISSVQGALVRLRNVKAAADKANDELRKAVSQVLSTVDLTEKELSGFETIAKKLKKPTSLSSETSKDLKKLSDEMKALKSAL